MRGYLEGGYSSLTTKVMELFHEVSGGFFSLFSPLCPRTDGHGF